MSEQTDLELIDELMDDYGVTPEDSIADLIEAIIEVQEGSAGHA